MMSHGPEHWHPNPWFFYQKGAGPMFDMGPYYMTALVHLLGPAKCVSAITTRAQDVRIAASEEHLGKQIPVDVPTHYAGTIEFHSGAVVTVTMSFDIWKHGHKPIEIYGTEGSLAVPDPNKFGGPVNMFTKANNEWQTQALSHRYADNARSIGAADMAYAILGKRKHRANGNLAYHILEIMHAFEKSSSTGRHVKLKSKPARPAALPLGLIEGRLD